MKPFIFDLKMFSEDGTAGSETITPDTVVTSEVEAGTTATEPIQANVTTTESHQTQEETTTPEFAIVLDEITGQRKIVQPTSEGSNDETKETEEPNNDEVTSGTAAPYTTNDLVEAMTTGSVDESRIPDNLKAHYAAIQAQQQLAYQKQVMQQMQQPQVQQPAQVTEEAPKEEVNSIEVYQQIQKIAEARALKDLGMTAAQFEELSYNDDAESISKKKLYDIAMTTNIQSLLNEVTQEKEQVKSAQAETHAALQEMVPVITEYQKDPHFGEIDHLMQTHYQTLPYSQATKIAPVLERLKNQTYTRADLPILDEYYKAARETFYSKLSGVSKTPQPAPKIKPPIVEGAGGGGSTPPVKVDFRQMRTMDARQRSEFLRNVLKQNP